VAKKQPEEDKGYFGRGGFLGTGIGAEASDLQKKTRRIAGESVAAVLNPASIPGIIGGYTGKPSAGTVKKIARGVGEVSLGAAVPTTIPGIIGNYTSGAGGGSGDSGKDSPPSVAKPANKGRSNTVAGPKTVTTRTKVATAGYPEAPKTATSNVTENWHTGGATPGRTLIDPGTGARAARLRTAPKAKPNLSHQGGSHDFSALKFFRGD
jgi:hypothetical protein